MTQLPEPVGTALVQGQQGSEYRLLSNDYEPDSAMHSPKQMRSYGAAEYQRGIVSALAVLTSRGFMNSSLYLQVQQLLEVK